MSKMSAVSKPEPNEIHLLSRQQVLSRIGVTYQSILTMMRKGEFPRSRSVGGRVFWVASEIDDWIRNLPVAASAE